MKYACFGDYNYCPYICKRCDVKVKCKVRKLKKVKKLRKLARFKPYLMRWVTEEI